MKLKELFSRLDNSRIYSPDVHLKEKHNWEKLIQIPVLNRRFQDSSIISNLDRLIWFLLTNFNNPDQGHIYAADLSISRDSSKKGHLSEYESLSP